MRIKGSDLKRIIKEEISRSMQLRESSEADEFSFDSSTLDPDDSKYMMKGGGSYILEPADSRQVAKGLYSRLYVGMKRAPLLNPIKNLRPGDEISVSGLVFMGITSDSRLFDTALMKALYGDTITAKFSPLPYIEKMEINGMPVSNIDLDESKIRPPGGLPDLQRLGTFQASFTMPESDVGDMSFSRDMQDEIMSSLDFTKTMRF